VVRRVDTRCLADHPPLPCPPVCRTENHERRHLHDAIVDELRAPQSGHRRVEENQGRDSRCRSDRLKTPLHASTETATRRYESENGRCFSSRRQVLGELLCRVCPRGKIGNARSLLLLVFGSFGIGITCELFGYRSAHSSNANSNAAKRDGAQRTTREADDRHVYRRPPIGRRVVGESLQSASL